MEEYSLLPSATCRKHRRQLLVWIVLGLTLAAIGYQTNVLVKNTGVLWVGDFMSFWAAGRLNLTGLNPYDSDQLLNLQRGIGWDGSTGITWWNPPWTLLFYMPFGLLSYSLARAFWLTLNFLLVFFCADCLWRDYDGPPRYRWLAWLVSLFFFPTIYVLTLGQNVVLALLGFVGFLHSTKNNQPLLAGICAFLVAIKPHLFLPFWVALILWVIDRRCWLLLAGITFAGSAATIIASLRNPAVITQYLFAIPSASNYLLNFRTPTPGTALRIFFGFEKTWIQFLPSALGIIWVSAHWVKCRRTWEWRAQMPLILLISLVTAFYTWSYDQVVLLVAVIHVAVLTFRYNRGWAIFWTITPYIALFIFPFILAMPDDFRKIWMAPSLLLWYYIVQKNAKPYPLLPPPQEGRGSCYQP